MGLKLLITILGLRVQNESWGSAGGSGTAMNAPVNMDMTPHGSIHIINSTY